MLHRTLSHYINYEWSILECWFNIIIGRWCCGDFYTYQVHLHYIAGMEEGTKTQRGQMDIIVVRHFGQTFWADILGRHFGLKFFEAFGDIFDLTRRAFWPGKIMNTLRNVNYIWNIIFSSSLIFC